MSRILPYGSWTGSLSAADVAASSRGYTQPRIRAGALYWVESRPEAQGRQRLVRTASGRREDVSPAEADVRCGIHEYGGGEYGFLGSDVVYVVGRGNELHTAQGRSIGAVRPQTRLGDFAGSPDGRWLVCVEEDHGAPTEPANRLVAFAPAADERRVLCADHDFVSSPCWSPGGERLAYLSWDHPDMPWDGTTLWLQGFGADGPTGSPRRIAGGRGESIFQPAFSPDGVLTFVSDRSGFGNLYQLRGDRVVALTDERAEFGRPQWVLGMRTYGFGSGGRILATASRACIDELVRVDPTSGRIEGVALPFSTIAALDVEGDRFVLLGAGATHLPTIVAGREGSLETVAGGEPWAGGAISEPVAFSFPSANDRTAHAFVYRPASDREQGPPGERPPLIVKSHGGPSAAATTALKPATQYWTSRGFTVVDVNYGGSTGYGRSYRAQLDGTWGIVDVEDCLAAARAVGTEGWADAARWLATGGSAGGYTTLCLLTFHQGFAAGASHYGIGDLEALVRDTHKFESRYMERLVGPYPAMRERYRERSPIHATDRLACPVIFFQGLEDEVVPPAQAEAMVDALAARGIAHAYVPFPGEGHGFRRAENIVAALEAELWFYGRVLGFETATPTHEIARVGGVG